MSISLRFFSSLPLDGIALDFLYGKERKLEELRLEKTRELREVVAAGVIDDALAFCVENKLNMIVSGGTSTGKTVAARKILSHVPAEERIVTIEEAAELAYKIAKPMDNTDFTLHWRKPSSWTRISSTETHHWWMPQRGLAFIFRKPSNFLPH